MFRAVQNKLLSTPISGKYVFKPPTKEYTMSIKVILFRRVPAEKVNDIQPLLIEMRSLAMAQRGYISGETLMNEDDPEEYLVISSWTTKSRWNEWFENDKRIEIQGRIDRLLGRKTMYQVYYNA